MEIWIAITVMLAAPMVVAADGPADEATWGLCQADDSNDQGDESSNGTIEETAPFANTSEEDCENSEDPWAGTPGADHVPENPGQPEDPGAPDNPGDDQQPEDPGNDGDDHPDEDENPGDDRGR